MKGKKSPTEVKKLLGTLRKDRVLPDEVQYLPEQEDGAPVPLSGFALEEWERVYPQVKAVGILNSVDKSLLASYCYQMGVFFEATKEFDKGFIVPRGGSEIRNPAFDAANKALTSALAIAVQFGFTPASRTKISLSKSKPVTSDKEAKFLKLANK